MSRKGVASTVVSLLIRMRPSCSAINSRPLPSPAFVTCVGFLTVATFAPRETAGSCGSVAAAVGKSKGNIVSMNRPVRNMAASWKTDLKKA
jgi:hypothetical protein